VFIRTLQTSGKYMLEYTWIFQQNWWLFCGWSPVWSEFLNKASLFLVSLWDSA